MERSSHTQAGVTLLEMMVALAIAGLVIGAMSTMVGRMRSSELRGDAGDVMGAIRSAFDRAAATSVHHRMLIDLDEGTFQLERCEGKVRLRRGEGSDRGELTSLNDQLAQVTAQLQNLTGNAVQEASETVKQAVGKATCEPLEGKRGELRKLKGDNRFSRVHVAHLEEPAEDGQVSLHFFPLGYGEKAALELSDGGDKEMTVIVHPLTGQVELASGGIRDLEDFVHEDAEGDEVEER